MVPDDDNLSGLSVMIIMDIIIRLADANNLVTVFNLYFNVILSLRTQIVAF